MTRLMYLPGDGYKYHIMVSYLADTPKNKRGLCAFCNGDPIGENSPPNARINRYLARSEKNHHDLGMDQYPNQFTVCPMCDGRPS